MEQTLNGKFINHKRLSVILRKEGTFSEKGILCMQLCDFFTCKNIYRKILVFKRENIFVTLHLATQKQQLTN